MLQRVYRQIKEAGHNGEITVATAVTQVESIKGQLGEAVSIVVEPERRNTFPAIALSAAYLYFEKNCSLEDGLILPQSAYPVFPGILRLGGAGCFHFQQAFLPG